MKVCVLDIDGVLNIISRDEDEYGDQFNPHYVNNLRQLVEKTDCKIVVSSSWRHSGIQFLRNMWRDRNYPGEIIDITPDFWQTTWAPRGAEIQDWLDRHNDQVTHYVILDDDTDMLESQLNNFVQCSYNLDHEDATDKVLGLGFTNKCLEKAIQILTN